MSKKVEMLKEEFILRLKQVGTDFKKKGIIICYTKLPSDIIENMNQFGGIPFIKEILGEMLSKRAISYLCEPDPNSLILEENRLRRLRKIKKKLNQEKDPDRKRLTRSNIIRVDGYALIRAAFRYDGGLPNLRKKAKEKEIYKRIGENSLKYWDNFLPAYLEIYMELGRHPVQRELDDNLRHAAYIYHKGLRKVRQKINQHLTSQGKYDLLLKGRMINHLKKLCRFLKAERSYSAGEIKYIFFIILTPLQVEKFRKLAELLPRVSKGKITLNIMEENSKVIYTVDKDISSRKVLHQLRRIKKALMRKTTLKGKKKRKKKDKNIEKKNSVIRG